MDPNAALAAIHAILRKYGQDGAHDMERHEVESLFNHVEALDGWIMRGGFLPDAWQKGR